jgi:hypothetical protein
MKLFRWLLLVTGLAALVRAIFKFGPPECLEDGTADIHIFDPKAMPPQWPNEIRGRCKGANIRWRVINDTEETITVRIPEGKFRKKSTNQKRRPVQFHGGDEVRLERGQRRTITAKVVVDPDENEPRTTFKYDVELDGAPTNDPELEIKRP